MNNLSISEHPISNLYFNDDDSYPDFELSLKEHFNKVISGGKKLFTTNVEGLYDLYLNNLPVEARQHYSCNACKHFIERFGGLVTIDEHGTLTPVMWNVETTPTFFSPSVFAMKNAVLNARVNGVFIPDRKVLGVPRTGEWTHLFVPLPREMVNRSVLRNASQLVAEKKEDFKMLMHALSDYSFDVTETAVSILQTESLYRSEKVLGVAEWFKNLHLARNGVHTNQQKENIVWLAVATAPSGFCHIRSSMIGTLLDNIASGMSHETVKRRFTDKMDPLKYQRPQAAPSAGNIAQAEKIVEKLGIQKSLVRRFARLDEINTIWKPSDKKENLTSGGIFSHLQQKNKNSVLKMNIPATKITWRKFLETVLPSAESIEYSVKNARDSYAAILTAEYQDAPPILQWDNEEQRNPFSWYVYRNGTSHSQWGLTPGYCKVSGITLQPSMWYEDNLHQGKSVFFILEGAKDNKHESAGNGLFPEILKSELREIRSTIEAYSKGETILGFEESSACGVRLQSGASWNTMFKVTTKTGTALYELDRWD